MPEEVKELSIDTWIMILNNEINREQIFLSSIFGGSLVFAGIVASAVGYLATLKDINAIIVMAVIFLIVFYFMVRGIKISSTVLDDLREIREYAIHNPLNSKEVHEKWEAYLKKNYFRLLYRLF